MNTEQDNALLPCPFCGEAEGLIIQHCEGTIVHPALRTYCDNCGASSGYSDREDPVENWNRRAALKHSCKETSQDREDAYIPEERSNYTPSITDCDAVIAQREGYTEGWNDCRQDVIDHTRRVEGIGK